MGSILFGVGEDARAIERVVRTEQSEAKERERERERSS